MWNSNKIGNISYRISAKACWLESTILHLTAGFDSENQSPEEMTKEKREELDRLYKMLQDNVAAIKAYGEPSGEEIDGCRKKLLTLLKLTGIKDDDLPLFEETHSARSRSRDLINSRSIMSKTASPCTPQRNTHQRRNRDSSSNADMLLEQLLVQSNSITDSDTSPPSHEDEEKSLPSVAVQTPRSNINNENTDKLSSAKNAADFKSDSESERPLMPPHRPLTDCKIGHISFKSTASLRNVLPPPMFRNPSQIMNNKKIQKDSPHHELPSANSSWSFYDMSISRPDVSGHNSSSTEQYVTVRDNSASKRRKANNKSALPMTTPTLPTGTPRQQLNLTPEILSPSSYNEQAAVALCGNTPLNRLSTHRKRKRQSPAMRRLIQQKENSPSSPSYLSPRRPLSDLNIITCNDSYVLTTSSNSLTPSSEDKSSVTSPDRPLPRRDDLLDRNAYYCKITIDRQKKLVQKHNVVIPKSNNDTIDECPPHNLVRMVEGAESSPSSFIFQIPSLPQRSSRKKVSHPLSSSTMLFDTTMTQDSPEQDSVYTWSIYEGSSSCNLEKSYIRSTVKAESFLKNNALTSRSPTPRACNRADSDTVQSGMFEISSMVESLQQPSEQPASTNENALGTPSLTTPKSKSKRNFSASAKKILAAAPSFFKRLSLTSRSKKSKSNNSSQLSDISSKQATTSLRKLKGLSAESSNSQQPLARTPVNTRRLSISEALLPNHFYDDTPPKNYASSMDESFDEHSQISCIVNRLDIPGMSNSSGSSSPITSARCRPYISRHLHSTALTDPEATHGSSDKVNQDLLDSILTDSPKC